MNKKENIIGKKFGRLVVLGLDEERNKIQYKRWENGELKSRPPLYYIVKCDCGNIIFTLKDSLMSGKTKSCGCIRREDTSKRFSKTNIYECFGDYYKIWDYKHQNFTTIDKEDYELVKKYYWGKSKKYWRTTINNKGVRLHDFIMQKDMTDKATVVDHIDRNPSNNRKNNLRIVTYLDNSHNLSVSKNNTSGVTGVGITKDGLWRAYICVKGERKYKYFRSFEEACYQRYLWEIEFDFILQDYFINNHFNLFKNK